MALENNLAPIPGLGAYLGMQQFKQRQALGDLTGAVGMLGALQRQQELEQQAQDAPLRRMALEAQVEAQRLALDDRRKQAEFFSPENVARYVSQGREAIDAPSAEMGGGPGRPAEAPKLDFDRFMLEGAMRGAIKPEVYMANLERKQAYTSSLAAKLAEIESRREDKNLDRESRERLAMQADQTRRELAQAQMDNQRVLRAMVQQNSGRPPSGYQFKPDGTLEPIPGGPGDKSNDKVQSLRKEFNALPEVKNYRTVVPIIQSIKNAKDTAAGDLDFIYAVGKILDSDSVVREGEMSLVIKSGSPLERIKGEINSVMGGGRLTTTTRSRLQQMLQSRVGELQRGYQAAESVYRRNAERMRLPSDEIFMDYGATDLPAQSAPAQPAGQWSIRKK